ncbi:MAG: endonuclease [Pseudomonadota bacterium]
MSEVNWAKYDCDICRSIGILASGLTAGLASWILLWLGTSVALVVLLFLVIWGVLGYVVDTHCRGRIPAAFGPPAERPADRPADDSGEAADAAEKAAAAVAAAKAEAARKAAEHADEAAATAPQQQAEANAAADEQTKSKADHGAAEEAVPAPDKGSEHPAEEAVQATSDPETNIDGDAAVEGARPEALQAPRHGAPDDLKRIKGIGPKLEALCNSLGFFHFDQIASWTPDEVAWVDSNLEGFKGRVTRDSWVGQAKALASGAEADP